MAIGWFEARESVAAEFKQWQRRELPQGARAQRKATAGSPQRHDVTEKCERFKTEGREKNGGQRESKAAEILRCAPRDDEAL
jgi:hypothetical protein